MHDFELFSTRVGLSINCEYPADDVRVSISSPCNLVILFFHHLEQRALKLPVIIEQKGNSSFSLLRSKSNFKQKFSNSSRL